MSPTASAASGIGYACFVIAAVLYVFRLLEDDDYLGRLAMATQAGGLLLWGAGWAWTLVDSGGWPEIGVYNILSCLVLVCLAASLALEWIYDVQLQSPWMLVLVLAIAAMVLFGIPSRLTPVQVTAPTDGRVWVLAYCVLAVIGYGLLLLSGALGVAELVRPVLHPRFPGYASLPESDAETLVMRLVRWALLALVLTLILRISWSWLSTGRYWSWALVEVWMLVTWCVYGVYVHWGRFRQWPIAIASGMVLVGISLAALS